MFSRLFSRKKSSASIDAKSSEPLPQDVSKWTQQHVVTWLHQNDMSDSVASFTKNAITGSELVELTEHDIDTLGVKKIGCRKKILKLIAETARKSRDLYLPVPSAIIAPHSPSPDELSESSEWSVSSSNSLRRLSSNFRIALPASLPQHLDEKYALFEDLPDGCIVMNLDKTIMYVNKSTERIFLYTRDELCGCNVKILMSEPHRSNHDGYIDRYLATGKANIIGKGRMVEAKAKDASLVPIWLSVAETEDDLGNKIFMGTFKDLRSINPTSKTAQNKMLALLDNLVDAAVVMSADSQIIFFNKSAEAFFGYSRDEVLGQQIEILIPPDVASKHKTFVSNFLKTKQGKVIGKGRNVEVLKKDGTLQTVFFSLTETKWGEGNSIAFCATLQPSTAIMDAQKIANSQAPKKVEEERKLDPNDPMTRLLQEVLDNPQTRMLFKQYLIQVKSQEPILFVEAVDEFRNLKSNLYRFSIAKTIYETFIKVDAPQELNLPSGARQELLGHFVEQKLNNGHCPVTIFNRAYEIVMVDLRNDCFSRFTLTEPFKAWTANPANELLFTKVQF